MPSRDEHLAKARHNEAFVASLVGTGYQDWRATGAFYAAVNYVDAYLAIEDVHPPDHRARDSYVGLDQHLMVLYGAYRRLKRDSEDARYRVSAFAEGHITARTLPSLERIKGHLRTVVPGV